MLHKITNICLRLYHLHVHHQQFPSFTVHYVDAIDEEDVACCESVMACASRILNVCPRSTIAGLQMPNGFCFVGLMQSKHMGCDMLINTFCDLPTPPAHISHDETHQAISLCKSYCGFLTDGQTGHMTCFGCNGHRASNECQSACIFCTSNDP